MLESIHEAPGAPPWTSTRSGGHPTVRYLDMIIPFWNASTPGHGQARHRTHRGQQEGRCTGAWGCWPGCLSSSGFMLTRMTATRN